MSASPTVRVLIANWNGRSHLETCLPSLAQTDYPNFRITLIDNGSTDESVEWTQRHWPSVNVLRLERNMGFATANNRGLRQATSEGAVYAVLLNNDTRVEPDWLAELVEVAQAHPHAAICQARQRTWAGDEEIRFRFAPEWAEAEAERHPIAPPGTPRPVAFASGCAMLLRCAALGRTGLFDERYFMYVEDVDLCLRAWIAGYEVLDAPRSVVYHRMSGSPTSAAQRMRWGYRNQLSTLLKNYQPATLRAFSRPIARRWLRGRDRVALRGTLAALAMLHGTLRLRRDVQRGRRCADSAFLDLDP